MTVPTPLTPIVPELPVPDVNPVVFLNGTYFKMGYQYGQQVAPYINAQKDGLWSAALKRLSSYEYPYEHAMKDLMRYEAFYKEYIPEVLDMMKGMAAGATSVGYEMTYYDILLINLAFTIEFGHPPEEMHKPIVGCSSTALRGAATKDGNIIVGMNRDGGWWSPLLDLYNITVIGFPDDGNNYIVSASAGSLHQNGSFLNEKGLVLHAQGSPETPGFTTGGENTAFYVALTSVSVDEAKDYYLVKAPFSGGNIMLVDGTGTINVIENYNEDVKITRKPGDFGEKDYVIMTNYFITPEGKIYNRGGPDEICRRYNTYKRNIESKLGKIDVGTVISFLSSHQVWDGTNMNEDMQFVEKTPCDHLPGWRTSQSFVILPEERVFYVCQGAPCGTWGDNALGVYVKFTLTDSPEAVVADCRKTADTLLGEASFENSGSPWYLMANAEFTKGNLAEDQGDIALLKYNDRDRASVLYGQAATHYAKTQAYALKASNAKHG